MISFDHETCRNLESALRKEWLETNGLGGFASSTIIGLNTRRYHGLLTAATRPPVGRMVLLSKMEEALVVAGNRRLSQLREKSHAPDGRPCGGRQQFVISACVQSYDG